MLQTGRAEKVDEKNGVKQFTYLHVKGLITRFQKMVLLCYDLMSWRY